MTCYYCGVRFEPDQLIVKVDNSKSKLYWCCDIAYYCVNHVPKGVNGIIAKASIFQEELPKHTNQNKAKPQVKYIKCPCGIMFQPTGKNQIYHDINCRRLYHKHNDNYTFWSDDELAMIKEYYHMGVGYLASMLPNRNKEAIAVKVSRMRKTLCPNRLS